jgi:acyl carrier protein
MHRQYFGKRARVSQQFRTFAAEYFAVPFADVTEDTRLETLQRDQFDLIRFSFVVEERFGFEFPEGLVGRSGRVKECRANTIRTVGEYVKYIARLPAGKDTRRRGPASA